MTKTRRQRTKQDAQRARMSQRRRFRGPAEDKHGDRSQSGVRIRSVAAWRAFLVAWKARVDANVARDEVKAGWRAREAEKRAEREAARP